MLRRPSKPLFPLDLIMTTSVSGIRKILWLSRGQASRMSPQDHFMHITGTPGSQQERAFYAWD